MPPMRFSHCADQVRGFWRGWDDDLLSFYENTPLYPYTSRPTAFRQWYKKGSNRADTVRQLSQHSILFRSFPLHKIKIPFFPKLRHAASFSYTNCRNALEGTGRYFYHFVWGRQRLPISPRQHIFKHWQSTKQIYNGCKIRENLQETGGMRRGETNNGNRCVCCKTVVAKSEQQAYENPCSGRGSVSVYHKGQIYRGRERFHLQKMDKCRQSHPGARERC